MWQPRLLWIGVSVSLVAHIVVLSARLLWLIGPSSSQARRSVRLVYDSHAVHEEGNAVDVRAKLQPPPAPTAGRSVRISVPDQPGGGGMAAALLSRGLAGPQASGRGAGEGASGSGLGGYFPGTSGAIDLTDVVGAANGDPVALTFFSAIREQIQRAADVQTWVPETESTKGIVYVVFKVDPQGRILTARSESDKPEVEAALGQAAVAIVQSAAPFPSFPPSFDQGTLAIMVPLDFSTAS